MIIEFDSHSWLTIEFTTTNDWGCLDVDEILYNKNYHRGKFKSSCRLF